MIVALRASSLAKFGEVDTVPVSECNVQNKEENFFELCFVPYQKYSYIVDSVFLQADIYLFYIFKVFMKRNFLPQFFHCIKNISQNHSITSLVEFL